MLKITMGGKYHFYFTEEDSEIYVNFPNVIYVGSGKVDLTPGRSDTKVFATVTTLL
jgi:hypothetical protein